MSKKPIFNLDDKDPKKLITKFNALPCFNGSGAEVTYISETIDRVIITIPLNEATSNFIGTVYGGSMYSATDAIYMVMLWYRLGKNYLLMDRSSKVRYARPGLGTLTAEFNVSDEEVIEIVQILKNKKAVTREYEIRILDKNEKLICEIKKEIYIRNNP